MLVLVDVTYRHQYEVCVMALSISTGLCDSDGREMLVGDKVRVYSDETCKYHGDYTDYKITQRGLTPMLSYLSSEKGQVFPVGGVSAPLFNFYDCKEFCLSDRETTDLVPVEKLVVVL